MILTERIYNLGGIPHESPAINSRAIPSRPSGTENCSPEL